MVDPGLEPFGWHPKTTSDANDRDLLSGNQFIHLGASDSQQAFDLSAVQKERRIWYWRGRRLIAFTQPAD